jgi:hypothetical protein
MPPASLDPVVAAIDGLRSDLTARHTQSAEAIAEVKSGLEDNTRKIEAILKGFPDGNPEGHRVYHEEIMQAIADRKRIRQAVLEHLLKTSTWLVVLGLGGMMLASARNWIRGVIGQ